MIRVYDNDQLEKARNMLGEYIDTSDITLVQINEWLNKGGSILNISIRDTIKEEIDNE